MNMDQISQLLSPEAYPEKTYAVFMRQTHISLLFFTDSHVFKIKKPVNLGFLDFSNVEKRKFFCNEEIRLNRRLAPDIYLDVQEVRCDKQGRVSIDGTGEVIDYAVKMVRMPEDRMMARMLDRGDVTVEQIDQLADLVAGFHEKAERGGRIADFGSVEAIRKNWRDNLEQTKVCIGKTISLQDHTLISAWVDETIAAKQELFESRVKDGFIRDCDGDLHTENICLDEKIHVFDCIEFNEAFRFSDTAADVAFLVMDLEYHGRRDLAERFIHEYLRKSGDSGLAAVLPLYLANRAFIRGKVESIRLNDPMFSDEEKQEAALRAKRFFRLARGYALRGKLPLTMFMTCGPSGCGKTVLASELAFQLGVAHFSSDLERKKLAGISPTERGADIYGAQWNAATYARLTELATAELAAGRTAVVDATFIKKEHRAPLISLAAKYAASVFILCPVSNEMLIKTRLEERMQTDDSVSDGTFEVYRRQNSVFEMPTDDEARVVVLDAESAPELMVDQVFIEISLINR